MSAHTQQADQGRLCGWTGIVGGIRRAERSRTRLGHFVDFLQILLRMHILYFLIILQTKIPS